ncbi:MAG TPA: 4-alpha-glucanotransferase [Tepidisphaeraceae bacterium]|jgi:4-alpha-glucanotransferase|nr:4-alpha-glucanotransferase [Tepidisphaeraceae bacterium]
MGKSKGAVAPSISTKLPRSSGVLLHVTSLPGSHGIGDLGPDAFRWLEMLAAAKQSWWQMLPLGPPGAGNSPYQCFSAFAGNPLLISPDALVADGLLDRSDLPTDRAPTGPVNYDKVERQKTALLIRAFDRFRTPTKQRKWAPLAQRFRKGNASWLDDLALFMALREAHDGQSWTQWSAELMRRRPAALAEAKRTLAARIEYHAFLQFLFYRQLDALRDRARRLGVKLIGDLPIFVSADSADVWANPHLFQLDRELRPKAVAGCPPDAFCGTGQLWGNPLYDWRAAERDGYAWWVARLRASLRQADLVRLDHFRGFEAYWRVPVGDATAEHGTWTKGPGPALFEAFRDEIGSLPLIAEDLGVITPAVERLRDRFELPGMRIVQFGFGDDAANPHLPHNYVPNAVTYPGTHDNDTSVGWYRSLDANQKSGYERYTGQQTGRDVAWQLIRLAWSSVASLAVAPLQDVMSLPSSARMNQPGTGTGNWRWRLSDFDAAEAGMERLGELTETFGRSASSPQHE